MNVVVARSGSRRSARAAMARVAAAASSMGRPVSIGTITCTPLAPLVLTAPSRPASASARRTRWAAATAIGNVSGAGRVQVEHEVGHVVEVARPDQRRVVLDGALVGEPEQCPSVVAERVGHVPMGRLCPQVHGRHPVGRVLGHVLLHERLLAAMDADDRQRPILQLGQDPVAHRVQVVNEIALRCTCILEQRLVEVRQGHAVPRLAVAPRAHALDASAVTTNVRPSRRPDDVADSVAPPRKCAGHFLRRCALSATSPTRRERSVRSWPRH